MVSQSHSLSVYFTKVRYHGVIWALKRFLNIVLEKVLRIRSHRLIIFYNDVMDMPPFPTDGIIYRNLAEEEIDKILNLKFVDYTRERVKEFFKRNSEGLGAFVGEELVGMTWAHHTFYDWPFFSYKLDLKKGEGYVGNTYVAPEFRGKNIHVGLLSRAMRVAYFRNSTRGYGSVHVDNVSSVSGIKKFGGHPMLLITTLKFLKFTLFRKEENIEEY